MFYAYSVKSVSNCYIFFVTLFLWSENMNFETSQIHNIFIHRFDTRFRLSCCSTNLKSKIFGYFVRSHKNTKTCHKSEYTNCDTADDESGSIRWLNKKVVVINVKIPKIWVSQQLLTGQEESFRFRLLTTFDDRIEKQSDFIVSIL